MEIIFPHGVEYKTARATIDEAIDNLKAQKVLIEEAVKVLQKTSPDMVITDVQITVVQVVAGSLITELLVKLYGSYQTTIEEAVTSGVEQMFGVELPEEYQALVTFAVLAVVYFVARYAYDAVKSKKEKKPASIHIEGSYNTVVNILADRIEVPVSQIEDALNSTVPASRKRGLIKQVTKFLRPNSDGRSGPVDVRGVGEIPPGVLDEYPNDSELAEIDESKNIDLPDVVLDIRAIDRDKSSTGWAAVLVGNKQFKKRLPMELYPTVNGEELAKLQTVRADTIISGDRRPDGSFKAKKIHLIKIIDDGSKIVRE